MQDLKILHVASFIGNIGDNASHYGTYKILDSIFNGDYKIDTLEIRKTYDNYLLKDKWQFDKEFAVLVNKYDILLIGGGCFLDFWVKNSVTGTTLNINEKVLGKIKVPIMICSMGCLPRQSVPVENIEKLQRFLDQLIARKNCFITLRNDSSVQVLQKYFGEKYLYSIPEVLDSAFFYYNTGQSFSPLDSDYIVINYNKEQLSRNNMLLGPIDSNIFKEEMIKVINYIIKNTKYKIVFTTHVYKDYEEVIDLLHGVNDYHLRTKIAITPYAQGYYGCEQIFSAYKNSSLVIGMRYHANVCSLAMNIRTIGVAVTDRVIYTYDSIGFPQGVVKADKKYSEILIDKLVSLDSRNYFYNNSEILELKQKETIKTYQKGFNAILR